MLCKPHYGNSHLEMAVCKWEALGCCIGCLFKNLFSNFCLHIKDSKWGRKCIFMNCASCNRSPQQIPLRQLPFVNETKPHYYCTAFWAKSTGCRMLIVPTNRYKLVIHAFFSKPLVITIRPKFQVVSCREQGFVYR